MSFLWTKTNLRYKINSSKLKRKQNKEIDDKQSNDNNSLIQ